MSAYVTPNVAPADPNQARLRMNQIEYNDGAIESMTPDVSRLCNPEHVSVRFESVSLPLDVASLLPQASRLAVEVLQNNATRNPLRALMFNVFARDGYNNERFTSLVAKIAEAAQMWTDGQSGPGSQVNPSNLRLAAEYVITAQLHFEFRCNLQAINQAGIAWPSRSGDQWLANFHSLMQDLRAYHISRRSKLGMSTQRHTSAGRMETWHHATTDRTLTRPKAPVVGLESIPVDEPVEELPAVIAPEVQQAPDPFSPPPRLKPAKMPHYYAHPPMAIVGHDHYGQPIWRPVMAPPHRPNMDEYMTTPGGGGHFTQYHSAPPYMGDSEMRLPSGPWGGVDRGGGGEAMIERNIVPPTVPSSGYDPVERVEASVVHRGQQAQFPGYQPAEPYTPFADTPAYTPAPAMAPPAPAYTPPPQSASAIREINNILAGMEAACRYAVSQYPTAVPGMNHDQEQTMAYALDLVLTMTNKLRQTMASEFGHDGRLIMSDRELVEILHNGDLVRKRLPIQGSASKQWAQLEHIPIAYSLVDAAARAYGQQPEQMHAPAPTVERVAPADGVWSIRQEIRMEPDTAQGPGRVVPMTEYEPVHTPHWALSKERREAAERECGDPPPGSIAASKLRRMGLRRIPSGARQSSTPAHPYTRAKTPSYQPPVPEVVTTPPSQPAAMETPVGLGWVQPTPHLPPAPAPATASVEKRVQIELPYPTKDIKGEYNPTVQRIFERWPEEIDYPGDEAVDVLLDPRLVVSFDGDRLDAFWSLGQKDRPRFIPAHIRENHARIVYALSNRPVPLQRKPVDVMALSDEVLGIGPDKTCEHIKTWEMKALMLEPEPTKWHERDEVPVEVLNDQIVEDHIKNYTGPIPDFEEEPDDPNAPDWRDELETDVVLEPPVRRGQPHPRILALAREAASGGGASLDTTDPRDARLLPGFVRLDEKTDMVQTLDSGRPYDHLACLPESIETGISLEDQAAFMTPAHLSSWTVERTKERPYPPAFDRWNKALFHLRTPNNSVLEVILERNEKMEYMDHELNPTNRQSVRQTSHAGGPKVVKRWPLATKVSEVPKPEDTEGKEFTDPEVSQDDGSVESIQDLKQNILAHSMAEAAAMVITAVIEEQIDTERPYQAHIHLLTPVVGADGVEQALEEIEKLSSLREVADRFKNDTELMTQLGSDTAAWLDDQLTRRVNETLKTELSLTGWTIDGFTEDYAELLAVLHGKFGEGITAALESRSTSIITTTLARLQGDSLETYRSSAPAMPPNLVVFAMRSWTTYVPWLMSDLVAEGQTHAVIDTSSPVALQHMAKGLDAALPETDPGVKVARRVLVDAVGNRYRFFRAGLVAGNYLISRSTPESEL